ncbi:MAG: imidazoleglycerol-phosphate dehydratase HisB [Candidatus Marinimicrobia bacterium]|nr:imidazoleglycerol-phosphate dehydratase HisB [Candidatus Neomarinimicrobiota bacterium]
MTNRSPIEIKRRTNETNIHLKLLLSGERKIQVDTGIGFLDHMLKTLAFWAGWDLELTCQGDLNIDTHHTVEDVALSLGQAFAQAREGTAEIERFGSALAPLDEALCQVVADLSGRPYCVFDASFNVERVGAFETTLTGHFFRSFATEARINLHLRCLYGEVAHHIIEALFKATGLALRQALVPRTGGVASTKGSI